MSHTTIIDSENPPAFPSHGSMGEVVHPGMSLLDYFAVHASEEDVRAYLPATMGETADLLVKLGWIKPYRPQDVSRSHSDEHRRRLRHWARYQHAAAMLKARSE